MVAIGMSLMPLKVIERKVCLWAKVLSGLSMDLGPKKSTHLKKGGVKRNKGLYEGERWRCAL